ncbi:hydroxymethylglutaryl-CoA lyase, partial [Variovorax sp. OK212]
ETGIDMDKLIDAGVYISQALGREPNSLASKALRTMRPG